MTNKTSKFDRQGTGNVFSRLDSLWLADISNWIQIIIQTEPDIKTLEN